MAEVQVLEGHRSRFNRRSRRTTAYGFFIRRNELLLNGNPQFETTRSPLGELAFQLKRRGRPTASHVADAMAKLFEDKPKAIGRIDLIVPVPASTVRAVVVLVAYQVVRRTPCWRPRRDLVKRLGQLAVERIVSGLWTGAISSLLASRSPNRFRHVRIVGLKFGHRRRRSS